MWGTSCRIFVQLLQIQTKLINSATIKLKMLKDWTISISKN